MGLLNSDLIADIKARLLAIRDDNPTDITIRRNGNDLGPYTVRIASKRTQPNVMDSGELQAVAGAVTVLGASDLDIQPQDRFTDGAFVYEVLSVAPNRDVGTVAQAQVVQ